MDRLESDRRGRAVAALATALEQQA